MQYWIKYTAFANPIGLFADKYEIRRNDVTPLRAAPVEKLTIREFGLATQVILHKRIGIAL